MPVSYLGACPGDDDVQPGDDGGLKETATGVVSAPSATSSRDAALITNVRIFAASR
jgi:hypothetical protein